jgi:ATP-binding protein involved in chromosome partitioning
MVGMSAPSAAPVTDDALRQALATVIDPEIRKPVTELGMVESCTVDEAGRVAVTILLTVSGCPMKDTLTKDTTAALAKVPGVTGVTVSLGVMSDEQRTTLREQLRGGTPEREIPFARPGSLTRVYAVASGKGGVGKSSVTVNLAASLAESGLRVGVVDADVYGFSVPRMLGADRDPVVIDQMLVPPESYGVRCISIGYFVPEGQAVVWRGPMLHKALEQFLTDVFWDEPDFLLVDMPPGTGDIALSLSQYLPRAEVYVVTTPQPAAQKVAALSAAMAAKVNMSVRGVIENMSWFTGDDGRRYEIFGSGGGQELADQLGVPLLGQLPLVPELRQGGDDGTPIVVAEPDSEAAKLFHEIATRIAVELKPRKVYSSALKIS